jgi:hypothetical protein
MQPPGGPPGFLELSPSGQPSESFSHCRSHWVAKSSNDEYGSQSDWLKHIIVHTKRQDFR